LGEDIDQELPRKIRNHVRQLCCGIMSEVEKKLKLAQEKQLVASDQEMEVDLVDQDEAYQWSLCQLRVFLLSYSLLSEFLVRLSIAKGADVSAKTPVWPLVCSFGSLMLSLLCFSMLTVFQFSSVLIA
jgi:hypothetical protein